MRYDLPNVRRRSMACLIISMVTLVTVLMGLFFGSVYVLAIILSAIESIFM